MKKPAELHPYVLPILTTTVAFILYTVLFSVFHHHADGGIASLAILPVVAASWYFGTRIGILIALLTILVNLSFLVRDGHSLLLVYGDLGQIINIFVLLFTGVVVGRLSHTARERTTAILRLEQYEKERRSHTDFLELLNEITARALEADNLRATLDILTEQVAKQFNADDGYFSLWDTDKNAPIPITAYGSMHDIYSYFVFEHGERTLSSSVLNAEHPIAVPDIENSNYIDPEIAALFPNRSMLGLPFIAQRRKLGALLLGYKTPRTFDDTDIHHARVTAEQVAFVLSKSLLLDEERKQVKQLTALHDVALISIEAEQEDHLIEQVTKVIGKNLFPDNFGILLLNEKDDLLCAHPSYIFYGAEDLQMRDIHVGEGITGFVAKTGLSQRVGDVRLNPQYVAVDERTISELCVPIKFKDRVLGVINAESMKRNTFTADDERLLVTLAGQLATAIEQMRTAEAERVWLKQLAHSNDLIYSIAQITTQIEKALTMEEIIQTLGQELHNLNLTCIMAVCDEKQEFFTVNYTSLEPQFLEIINKGLGYPLVEYTFPRSVLEQISNGKDILHPVALSKPEEEIQVLFTGAERPGVLRILTKIGVTPATKPLRLPLIFEKILLGMLWVWGDGIQKSDLPIMSIFAKQVGVSLERARLFQEVQSLALTDPLTGLHNRRNIFNLGRIEFSRAHRMNRPFCCMMLDLDHFKQINDHYGHQAGDQVLQECAHRCKHALREMDIVGRYGGEELIIIMPETQLSDGLPVAERLRMRVAEKPITIPGHEINVTVSIGIAQKDENTTQLETLIARADQAMYIAKHKGRNQVAMSK